jgi:DNA-binding transcriptional regulator of glucitol operon
VLRLALRRQWVTALFIAVVGAVLCTFLGNWQWHKSQSSHGDIQNLVYSFNWWLFAALCLGVWGKALRDESRRLADPEAGLPGIAGLPKRRDMVVAMETDDPEVDEWNAWLAELGSRDRRAGR